MSDNEESPKNVVEFRASGKVAFRREKKNKWGEPYNKLRFCKHLDQIFDEDTELVECGTCGATISIVKAYLAIVDNWSDINTEVIDWQKVDEMNRCKDEENKQKALSEKAERVRGLRKELQWIQLPEIGDEPARSYWTRVTEATGNEPYAMFKQGRKRTQYCVMTSPRSWCDADFLLASREKSKVESA